MNDMDSISLSSRTVSLINEYMDEQLIKAEKREAFMRAVARVKELMGIEHTKDIPDNIWKHLAEEYEVTEVSYFSGLKTYPDKALSNEKVV